MSNKNHLSADEEVMRKISPVCKFSLVARGIASFLLGALAVGLFAFGTYSITGALYRKIDYRG